MGAMTAEGIELRGLAKSYGRVRAVRDVSISIDAGQTVALLGPNGAGKSTTIDMMLGLARPDRGDVRVFGLSPEAAVDAGIVGAMLQVGQPIRDLSVRELVTMVGSLYPDPLDVDDVLALTGTTEVAGRRTQKLSGGQTQRVSFATALVANPRLLVLDEPTVAMDVEGRHHFWTTMREFASRGRTIVFATRYLGEADAYQELGGIAFPLYYMTGMASWSSMMAVMASGARIAGERSVGWNRQLRITPLPTRVYFRAKIVTGYGMAAITIGLLYRSGAMLGVRLSAGSWLTMTGLILVGLIPFAVLGVLLGHLFTVDSMGPAWAASRRCSRCSAARGGRWPARAR